MDDPYEADREARDRALDIERSFIVRAPAGSGKTRLLIQRYLALLACAGEPEEIVAITFTRKAASEMRERVARALAAADGEDDRTASLAARARARDGERGWQLAANPARMRIMTIDALSASLTRQMPLASRFGAQPALLEDAGDCYAQAARATVELVHEDHPAGRQIAVLLEHLDNDMARVTELLAQMLATRDQWLRTLSGIDDRARLELALQRAREAAVRRAAAAYPPWLRDETLALVRFAGPNRPEDRAGAGVFQLDRWHDWPSAHESDHVRWLWLADFLLTKEGSLRSAAGLRKSHGFPAGEGKAEKGRLGAMKARMGALLEALRTQPVAVEALAGLRLLPEARYRDADWAALGAITTLLPIATAMLWQVFAARGACDFIEIAQSAARALGDDEAATDLALALDYRLRHLLVDEFQDTSFAQFDLIERLMRGWCAGDGRSFFAVGDPMQSIYRFRAAEVALFMRAARSGIAGVALEPVRLAMNFRSAPAIVAWVNAAFAPLMGGQPTPGAVPFEPCAAARENIADSGVRVHALIEWPGADCRTEEASRVVEIIKSRWAADAHARVAILVRVRAHLGHIVPALKAAGIAFRAVDIDPLADRPVVRDLLALTRALCHPADRIAWFAVLRAPWCGLTAEELAQVAGGAATREGELAPDPRTVWQLIHEGERLAPLEGSTRARIEHVKRVFSLALARHRRAPLRDTVESIWLALGGPLAAGADALEDAAVALDAIESEARAQTGGTHIEDFVALDRKIQNLHAAPRVAPGPAVEVMTIHKSKGLEFDTVIVPALERAPRSNRPQLLSMTEVLDEASGERHLLVAPVRETGSAPQEDATLAHIRSIDAARQREEEVRLLYVAATRAARDLHWIGSVGVRRAGKERGVTDAHDAQIVAPHAGSLLARLWPAVKTSFRAALGLAPGRASETVAGDPVARAPCPPPMHLKVLAARDFGAALEDTKVARSLRDAGNAAGAVDFDWAGELARQVGVVVHRQLQRIVEEGLERWPEARLAQEARAIEAALKEAGVGAAHLGVAVARVQEALQRTLGDARGRWLLGAHEGMRSEWRLAGLVDGQVRHYSVDLCFVEQGTRWIVDFKTGTHEGGNVEAFLDNERERYRAQLETYGTLISAIDAGAGRPLPMRLALYFPLMGGWREWAWRAPRA